MQLPLDHSFYVYPDLPTNAQKLNTLQFTNTNNLTIPKHQLKTQHAYNSQTPTQNTTGTHTHQTYTPQPSTPIKHAGSDC